MTTLHDFSAKTLGGREQSLAAYKGQVLLVVNTASECGYTPQYEGLEALYQKLGPQKFSVLGFPCNQFGGQEPGTEAEIGAFCTKNYGVTFPMFAKVDVNGANAHPVFKFLKGEKPGVGGSEAIKWNFTKFLVDRDGNVVRRYGSSTEPAAIAKDINALL